MPPDVLLLETDQVDCYAEDGTPVSCSGSGQDASREKRMVLTDQRRFLEMGPLIRDRLTGAVWSRDANPAEFPLTWQEALDFIAGLRENRTHGRDDWRLPSRRLLFSLISHQSINPALPAGHPFENVFTGYYWSGDTCRRLENQAWYVHLGGGRVHRGMKHGSYMVWPVCSSQIQLVDGEKRQRERFSVYANHIYDTRTGLTWSGDADPVGKPLSWKQALSTVKALNDKAWQEHNNWRMPTIRELESLVSLKSHSPALPTGHPFTHVREAYWSSTTSAYEPRYAWTLYSQDGIVGVGFKAGAEFHLWPVHS